MLTDCDQERLMRSEAKRLARILDKPYEEVLRALKNLIDKGLIKA